jgi:hypothetical protein
MIEKRALIEESKDLEDLVKDESDPDEVLKGLMLDDEDEPASASDTHLNEPF